MNKGKNIIYCRPEINALANRPEKVSLAEFTSFAKLNMKEQKKLFENAADDLVFWGLEKLSQFLHPETPVERVVLEVIIPKAVAIMKRPVPKPNEPNLDLAGFWNPLMMRFPKGVQMFSAWIDEYKQVHRWREFMPSAKFHDLPLGLQVGLMELFFHDTIGGNFCFIDIPFEDQKNSYAELFEFLHNRAPDANEKA